MHREFACAALVALMFAAPARADLYEAVQAYKKGDHARAYDEFRALAELGQPIAQYNVAVMYARGEGVQRSMTFGYAWAMIALDNGHTEATSLADELRPLITPGSIRIAEEMRREFSRQALETRLMPVIKSGASLSQGEPCAREKTHAPEYPESARRSGQQGRVYVEFTILPDGTARHPRILFAVPAGVFEDEVRRSVLRSTYIPARRDGKAIPCHQTTFYRFTLYEGSESNKMGAEEYIGLEELERRTREQAERGDVASQMLYGMMLAGLPQLSREPQDALPWFLKAAQAGAPLAQYQVGYSMLRGWGCQCEENKGLIWLRKAAEADQPDAQVTLASYALRDELTLANVKRARTWLERAAATGHRDAKVYLSAVLAAAPFDEMRDPERATELIKEVFRKVDDDPVAFEIRAAAAASSGDFKSAVKDQARAIAMAKRLKWNLAPLDERLAHYQAGKAWHGDLLGLADTAVPL